MIYFLENRLFFFFFFSLLKTCIFDSIPALSIKFSQQSNRQLREHLRYGVYVEGLTEQVINSPEQAMEWLSLGAQNRHTGCTAMNRESSRSHSVFRISIQAKVKDDFGGVTSSQSVLNLVDLAGSERQRSAKTEGLTLKEASNINRSLSALGNVINALASVEQGQVS